MKLPVTYRPNFLSQEQADFFLRVLRGPSWNGVLWERHGTTPRYEYYCNTVPKPYTYGRGLGVRTYQPKPFTAEIGVIRDLVEQLAGCKFEVCFLNGYEDGSDQLGWHADNSPEMDDARPIAIVSLGGEREIMFRPSVFSAEVLARHPELLEEAGLVENLRAGALRSYQKSNEQRLTLQHGSLCLMASGMQDVWQHRIPKAGHIVAPRVSLTFRGYVNQESTEWTPELTSEPT